MEISCVYRHTGIPPNPSCQCITTADSVDFHITFIHAYTYKMCHGLVELRTLSSDYI